MILNSLLQQNFPVNPTSQQLLAFAELDKFIESKHDDECFVLKGYAGTGKTTIVASLVKVLPKLGFKTVLLAPTGRAAKVISNYSGKKALTIHKRIYRKKSAMSLDMSFIVAENLAESTIFIVDEASMISNESDFGGRSLLEDLLMYVYNGKNCKLMLVGDTAQLPPVGSDYSPALDTKLLQEVYTRTIFTIELTDVVRQQKQSGILFNATHIRELIRTEKEQFPQLKVKGFPDIYNMTGEKLPEGLEYAYNKYGIENTLVVCRSNKSANNYNLQIRNRILY
ncbi:MAG: ATP-dependent DNA helicase, partial [Sphingobacteriaceae bacterium]